MVYGKSNDLFLFLFCVQLILEIANAYRQKFSTTEAADFYIDFLKADENDNQILLSSLEVDLTIKIPTTQAIKFIEGLAQATEIYFEASDSASGF